MTNELTQREREYYYLLSRKEASTGLDLLPIRLPKGGLRHKVGDYYG